MKPTVWTSRFTTRVVTISELILYSTGACHLCELAAELVRPWLEQGWSMEVLDITDDKALLRQYRLSIPVLKLADAGGGARELAWPFDAGQLQSFLTGEAPPHTLGPSF